MNQSLPTRLLSRATCWWNVAFHEPTTSYGRRKLPSSRHVLKPAVRVLFIDIDSKPQRYWTLLHCSWCFERSSFSWRPSSIGHQVVIFSSVLLYRITVEEEGFPVAGTSPWTRCFVIFFSRCVLLSLCIWCSETLNKTPHRWVLNEVKRITFKTARMSRSGFIYVHD